MEGGCKGLARLVPPIKDALLFSADLPCAVGKMMGWRWWSSSPRDALPHTARGGCSLHSSPCSLLGQEAVGDKVETTDFLPNHFVIRRVVGCWQGLPRQLLVPPPWRSAEGAGRGAGHPGVPPTSTIPRLSAEGGRSERTTAVFCPLLKYNLESGWEFTLLPPNPALVDFISCLLPVKGCSRIGVERCHCHFHPLQKPTSCVPPWFFSASRPHFNYRGYPRSKHAM